jgi:hypothetical protein
VLAEQLDVLLGGIASLVDRLAALASAFGELFGLVLDFGVKAVEDGENGALEFLGGGIVLVGDALQRRLEREYLWLEGGRMRTWVFDLMFSNMPATPPSDWSKWCPSFKGSLTV